MRVDVGYGRPPVEKRFQKGRSGNPGGRPGPRRELEKRFQEAVVDALLTDPEALLSREPESEIARLAKSLVCRAALADTGTLSLLFGLLPERGRRPHFPVHLFRALACAQATDERPAAQSQGI